MNKPMSCFLLFFLINYSIINDSCGSAIKPVIQRSSKSPTLRDRENEPTCGQNIYGDSSNFYTDNLESEGAPELELSKRIVSGQSSRVGEWPWLVSLIIRKSKGKRIIFCGGTLIHPQWVLTARHCTEPYNIKKVSVDRWIIRVGEHDMSNKDVPHLDMKVAEIFDNAKHKLLKNDIALIKLKQPVPLSKYVNIACLPHKDEVFAPGTVCTVAGWGLNATFGNTPDILQHVNVPIVANKECVEAYTNPKTGEVFVHNSNICAGATMMGACEGDSGGPLMCLVGSRWKLAGVVSFGAGTCGVEGHPGVFTKVTSYLSWIRSVMNAK